VAPNPKEVEVTSFRPKEIPNNGGEEKEESKIDRKGREKYFYCDGLQPKQAWFQKRGPTRKAVPHNVRESREKLRDRYHRLL